MPRHRREGFTLLEVLLASALAMVLMAALYVALDVQLRLAADGREAIEQATVTRAIVHRFDNDASGIMGPVAPALGKGSSSAGASGTGGTGMGTSGTGMGTSGMGTSGTSGMGAGATTDPTTGEAVMEMTTMSTALQFQAGVIGETDGENRSRLTMFVTKVAGQAKNADESGEAPNAADIRRVTYWMTEWGLARQEMPWVTSENLQLSTEPEIEDGKEERDYVIAEEVTKFMVEYWDGSTWAETWDGRTMGSDGRTLMGPPMAIRIRFWLNVPGPERGETVEKEFRHTISIRSAPGPAASTADTAATAAAGAAMGMTTMP
jgi:hypothetical protein